MSIILGVYIVLLVVGGVMGFVKAGSKVSLVTSLIFAAALAICAFGGVPRGLAIAHGLQVVLLAVFIARYVKTKKFMPAGLMIAVTAVALVAEFLLPTAQ